MKPSAVLAPLALGLALVWGLDTCSDALARPTVLGNGIVTDGGISRRYSDSSGSPGNATINLHCGRSAIAAGASAATITNTLVAATSIIFVVPESADATLGVIICVPGAGSFVCTNRSAGVATNVTANTTFTWCVTPVF